MERELADLAREAGFPDVIASHEVARELGFLARGQTTTADAYLTPLACGVTSPALARALPGSRLRFMQSSGGLTEAARFRGPDGAALGARRRRGGGGAGRPAGRLRSAPSASTWAAPPPTCR